MRAHTACLIPSVGVTLGLDRRCGLECHCKYVRAVTIGPSVLIQILTPDIMIITKSLSSDERWMMNDGFGWLSKQVPKYLLN